MNVFPKTHKRKKTVVPFAVADDKGNPVITKHSVVGVERLPLIVHRKVSITGDYPNQTVAPMRSDQWTITHVFTGFNLGVHGSYRFCSAVANRLLNEPILYLPSHKMMVQHKDFACMHSTINDLMMTYWDLK
jgi:hypothetical protein